MILLILLVTGLSVVSADEKCKNPKPMERFQLQKFAGRWWQYSFYSEATVILGDDYFQECVTQQYDYLVGGHPELTINNTQRNIETGQYENSISYAVYADERIKNGFIKVTAYTDGQPTVFDYYILAFDEDHFTIIHNCLHNYNSGWILTREKNPCEKTVELINEALEEIENLKNAPKKSAFKRTSQEGCYV